jgi:hypothetical protein
MSFFNSPFPPPTFKLLILFLTATGPHHGQAAPGGQTGFRECIPCASTSLY